MTTKVDPKRWLWLNGLQVPLLPLYSVGLSRLTDSPWVWYLTPALVFVLIPVLDYALGTDDQNLTDDQLQALTGSRYHRWIAEAYIPLQLAMFPITAWFFATADSLIARVGIVATAGIVGGIAINTAHELGHKRGARAKWAALLALAQTSYGHFYIEHNRGHHRHVATPEDPASARFGESLWRFLPRTVIGSFASAVRLERARLERKDQRWLSHNNILLQGLALTAVLYGVALAVGGPIVVPFLIAQAAGGIFLLEVVNYLEHYGLLRQKLDNGRYVACQPEHSWNSNNRVSNLFLYHLQRHSDHHANPTREYQLLRNFDGLPTLPSGYATMILLALIPRVWRRVMDPRVMAHYDGDRSLVNAG
jgi:alkane 1-monooxygenase